MVARMTSQPSIPASIGPYPIERELGRGGMGVVYLARDPRLNRPVAIKVLPEEVARDPMRLSRFEREARTLAALNHKNVGLIYGLEQVGEQRLLVLEFIPGVTLTGRLTRGPMSLDEAFRVCVQVAEGLEAAHERDVVHRDLKPDNLKITPDGTVKILDFGLATTRHGEGGVNPEMATLAGGSGGPLTQQGMVMGTPGYMSPEQARGLAMDKRTDIWAFGCVLYECLTGTRAFNGLTASDMLVAVIEREPDYNALPARTPGRIRELLRKCLIKDARRRLRDIGDARNELEDVLSQPQSGWYRAAAGVGGSPERPRIITRLSMSTGEHGVANAGRSSVAMSPDGQAVAFIAGHPPQTQLFVRRLDNPEPLAIPGTAGAEAPFFSPDGQKVAFFEGGKLKRVSLTGGAPTVLAAAPRPQGGCWAEGDFIYFIPDWGKGLMRIPGGGGAPEVVAEPDLASGEIALMCPEVLPTGNAALVAVWTGAGFDAAMIVAIDLRTGQRRPLVQGGMNPRFASSGHLVFTRIGGGTGALLAVAFDPERLEVFGQPTPIEDRMLGSALGGAVHFDVGGDGTLVYAPGAVWEPRHALLSVERAAAVLGPGEESAARPVVSEERSFVAPAVSPDGTRLAVQVQGTSDHLYLYDLTRGGAATRLTFQGDNAAPVWSPDSTRLAFAGNLNGQQAIYAIAADGAGTPELLFAPAHLSGGAAGSSPSPCGFTRDGRHLLFTLTRPQGGVEIWMVTVGDPASARPIVQTSRNAWAATASPDGRYVAFACDETGREEVYIQQIPAAGGAAGAGPTLAGRRQVTPEGAGGSGTGGGTAPLFLPGAGGELAYRSGDQIVAVRVATEPNLMVGRPRVLAQVSFLPATLHARNYDAMPDGQRFVVARAEEDRTRVTQLNVVLNWTDDLRRRVPVPMIAQPTRSGLSHSRLPLTMQAAVTTPAAGQTGVGGVGGVGGAGGTPTPAAPNTAFTEAATIMRPPESR